MPEVLGFQKDADGTIRIRLYTQIAKTTNAFGAPLTWQNSGSFEFQVELSPAQWNTVLAQTGTSSGGAQGGHVDVEVYSPQVTPAGKLPPNKETV